MESENVVKEPNVPESESEEHSSTVVVKDSTTAIATATTTTSTVTVENLTSSLNVNSISPQIPPPSPSLTTKPLKKSDKINVLLKPVGDAPILKQKLWAVDPDKQVSGIIQFIRNYLRLDAEHSLFVFVNQAFAPSPDQLLRNLYECFGSDGKLILHYSTTVAWG